MNRLNFEYACTAFRQLVRPEIAQFMALAGSWLLRNKSSENSKFESFNRDARQIRHPCFPGTYKMLSELIDGFAPLM